MAYTRVFNHYNSSHVLQGAVSAHAVGNATFKLSRYGGCMEGSLTLDTSFVDRTDFAYNDWISFEHTPGTRWYYGQIKHRQSTSPQTLTLHLLGAVDQLHRIFPGSYTIPLVYGSSSGWFPDDPDKAHESYVGWTELSDIVKHLLDYDIVPATDIVYDAGDIEATGVTIKQLKFRGTEHALSIIKGLGLQGVDASWGVDADRGFFYIQKPGATQATYQEGVDVTLLRGDYGDAYLFNRLWLIGGWVYRTLDVGVIMPHYQFQQHYRRSTSVTAYGERRLKITAPWIRNEDDGYTFATSFLDVYATPSERAIVTVTDPPSLITPWGGQVRVLDRNGVQVALAHPIDIEYDFDEVPVARFEVGPIDPTVLYPDQDWDDRRPSSGGGEDAGTTVPPTTAPPTTAPLTTEPPTTAPVPTTAPPTTVAPTTAPPTTAVPTTVAPTTAPPTTAVPTTVAPTTAPPTTAAPTTAPPACPHCASPPATITMAITGNPEPECNDTWVLAWSGDADNCYWVNGFYSATWITNHWSIWVDGPPPCGFLGYDDVYPDEPGDGCHGAGSSTSSNGTCTITAVPTTVAPTTAPPTTAVPTTVVPTTAPPTTAVPTTVVPTTAPPTTAVPTTVVPTTAPPTTAVPTTAPPACAGCASPPATVTVTITGADDADCNGVYVVPRTDTGGACIWSAAGKPSVFYYVGGGSPDQWGVDPSPIVDCDCIEQVNMPVANCNTGASASGCGGTIQVTP